MRLKCFHKIWWTSYMIISLSCFKKGKLFPFFFPLTTDHRLWTTSDYAQRIDLVWPDASSFRGAVIWLVEESGQGLEKGVPVTKVFQRQGCGKKNWHERQRRGSASLSSSSFNRGREASQTLLTFVSQFASLVDKEHEIDFWFQRSCHSFIFILKSLSVVICSDLFRKCFQDPDEEEKKKHI